MIKNRPENITKMLKVEVEAMSLKGAQLFDLLPLYTTNKLGVKDGFRLGFIHGREKALEVEGNFIDPKLTEEENTFYTEHAHLLFDSFTKDTRKYINSKQAYILGFLHGREYTLDEMGAFDPENDDTKIYAFIKRYDGRIQTIEEGAGE